MDKDKCLYEIMQCDRCREYVKNKLKAKYGGDFNFCDRQYDALKACLDAEKAKSVCQSKSK